MFYVAYAKVRTEFALHHLVDEVHEKDANGNPKQVQTDNLSNKIVRVLDKTESDDIINTLKKDAQPQSDQAKK